VGYEKGHISVHYGKILLKLLIKVKVVVDSNTALLYIVWIFDFNSYFMISVFCEILTHVKASSRPSLVEYGSLYCYKRGGSAIETQLSRDKSQPRKNHFVSHGKFPAIRRSLGFPRISRNRTGVRHHNWTRAPHSPPSLTVQIDTLSDKRTEWRHGEGECSGRQLAITDRADVWLVCSPRPAYTPSPLSSHCRGCRPTPPPAQAYLLTRCPIPLIPPLFILTPVPNMLYCFLHYCINTRGGRSAYEFR